MKTVKELSIECGVHRTTLNKAIERGDFAARKSGSVFLIDEDSPEFKAWLAKHTARKSSIQATS